MRKARLATCKVICFNESKIQAIKKQLPSESQLEDVAQYHKMLGHPTRQAILHVLSMDECCVCDLANILDKPVPTVSQHLRLLVSGGILCSNQEGKLVFYSLVQKRSAVPAVAEDEKVSQT